MIEFGPRLMKYPTGIRPRASSIEVWIPWPRASGKKAYATISWPPTPANIERAGRLRQRMVDAIDHGIFRWADFLPNDPRAEHQSAIFAEYAQMWLDDPQNDWKPQSRYKFRGILQRVWMPTFHNRPLAIISYADISACLAHVLTDYKDTNGQEPSKSLYNDWLLCIRGVFALAVRDGIIPRLKNPTAELRNKTRDKIEPDPFTLDEAVAIISDIYDHDGPMWGAWFELGFFSGMRYPSEPAALTWQCVDLSRNEIIVRQIRSKHARDGIQKSTKTGRTRTVMLNSRALHAIKTARSITGFRDDLVFLNGDSPVITGDPQRAMWRASIRRLGIRYRDPYNMRHTYATIGLISGANPAFMAQQLGHSVAEFFRTYAKWVGHQNDRTQIDIIEASLNTNGGFMGVWNR